MKPGTQYQVKGIAGVKTYLEVLHERRDGYDILITSVKDKSVKESHDYISRHLLEMCVRTGYLQECKVAQLQSA